MDPLSITASAAGIASAGVSVSSALFNIVSAYRDAPKEIADMARGVTDLSLVLDHLVDVLREGRYVYRRKLLQCIDSAVCRIDDVHQEIWDLVEAGNKGLARLKWIFRRSKTTQLVMKIEAHKSTLQIMTTTLLLALEQRKISDTDKQAEASKPARSTRRRLRRRAENLVQSVHQSLREITEGQPGDEYEETGLIDEPGASQTVSVGRRDPRSTDARRTAEEANSRRRADVPTDRTGGIALASDTSRGGTPPASTNASQGQLQKYNSAPDDTALWLYRTVFTEEGEEKSDKQDSEMGGSKALVLREAQSMSLVVSRRARCSQVVDCLLWDWTRLSGREIDETSQAEPTGRPTLSGRHESAESRQHAGGTRETWEPKSQGRGSPGPRPQGWDRRGAAEERSKGRQTQDRSAARTGRPRSADSFTKNRPPGHGAYSDTGGRQPYNDSDDNYYARREKTSSQARPLSDKGEGGTSGVQKAVLASLIAGATEAFRNKGDPGGWGVDSEKTKRVLTAAAGAAMYDPSRDKRNRSR